MKKLFYGLMLAGMLIMVTASPILAAVYYASVQVQESDGDSYTRLPISASLDNEYLADNNYILATGLDTRVITGSSVELPHLVVDDRLLFVSNINANNTYNFKYTTGNTPLADMPVIVGYDGYVTVSDDADLELGDDFEIEFDGYVDTSAGADKNLVYKEDAFRLYVSDDDEITATFSTWSSPTSHIDPSSEWDNEPNAYDDDTGTRTVHIQATAYLELYFPDEFTCGGVRIWGSNYPEFDVDVDLYYDSDWHNVWDEDDIFEGQWVEEYFATIDGVTGVRVKTSAQGTYPGYINEFDFLQVCNATATGISSGEHNVKAYADGTDLGIIVDEGEGGEVSDTTLLSGASVPDNANDIIINQNNVMPYFDYLKWTVGVDLIAWYQPVTMVISTSYDGTADSGSTTTIVDAELTQADDYWNLARLTITDTTDNGAPEGEASVITNFVAGTDTLTFGALTAVVDTGDTYTVDFGTLIDREGADENGIITWGVNPSGVDVGIGSLTAYSQPEPSGTIDEPGQDIVGETGQPGWTDETGTLTTNPFYPLVKMASDQTGFDVTQIWLMLATFFVLAGMLAVFGFVPHQLITVAVGGGLTGLFISMGIYPFWVIFIFLVMGVALVLWERAPTV